MGPDDWAAIDEALGRFTAASVIPLLGAAIDAHGRGRGSIT
jgi:hypothetical protein